MTAHVLETAVTTSMDADYRCRFCGLDVVVVVEITGKEHLRHLDRPPVCSFDDCDQPALIEFGNVGLNDTIRCHLHAGGAA